MANLYRDFISLLQKIFRKEEYRKVFKNFSYLAVLQVLNYVFPLLTFPYLVRVIGVEKYGLLSFAGSVIGFFNMLTDYGFNLSAPKEISINRENKEKLQEIFSSIFIIKFLFMVISFLILVVCVMCLTALRKEFLVYFFTFGVVVANVFFPVWFFQGIENMKYITFLNFLSRLVFTLGVFVIIRNEADYAKVPLLNFIGGMVTGFLSLFLIRRFFLIKMCWPKKEMIFVQLREGWHIFVSNIATSLYTFSTPFFLGLLTHSNVFVGYYTIADKIIQVIKSLQAPISTALYPFLSRKTFESKEGSLRIIRKITLIVFVVNFMIFVMLFLLSPFLIFLFAGERLVESIIVLRILAIHPLLIGLSNIFGIQVMLPFDRKKAFRNILMIASLLNVFLSFILVPFYKHVGSAISVTLVESFVTISMFLYLQRTGLTIIEKEKKKYV
ncbi:MAG: flippase [Brevinematales bacterium]|nr:flippase [Brevinematales bacterium]